MKIKHFVFLFVSSLVATLSYSQPTENKELQWIPKDSIGIHIFSDRGQITEWVLRQFGGKIISTQELSIYENKFLIIDVAAYSGFARGMIYVFEKKEELRHLLMKTRGRDFKELITVKVDQIEEELIFEGQRNFGARPIIIGKLSYEMLGL